MAKRFKDKVALVVGGTSGMGKSTALAFGREGAKVAVAGRRKKEGEEIAGAIIEAGGEAIFVQTNVLEAAKVEAMVSKVVDAYGRVDCALNCAGGKGSGSGEQLWDSYINTNLKGRWLCMEYEIPVMINQGSGAIVNIAAAYGLPGGITGGGLIAVAGNYGIVGMTRSAALLHAKNGIRVNAICVGAVYTAMAERSMERWEKEEPGSSKERLAELGKKHPLGRIGTADEVGETVLFLCSDAASFITGSALPVDGGWSAH